LGCNTNAVEKLVRNSSKKLSEEGGRFCAYIDKKVFFVIVFKGEMILRRTTRVRVRQSLPFPLLACVILFCLVASQI